MCETLNYLFEIIFKNGNVDSGYEKVPFQIEVLLNNINKSLFNFITSNEQEVEW